MDFGNTLNPFKQAMMARELGQMGKVPISKGRLLSGMADDSGAMGGATGSAMGGGLMPGLGTGRTAADLIAKPQDPVAGTPEIPMPDVGGEKPIADEAMTAAGIGGAGEAPDDRCDPGAECPTPRDGPGAAGHR